MAATLVVAGLGVVANAQSAPDVTNEQLQRISTNCVSIKSNLAQLHASDALLRVNRGQVYELMASKLMERFNDRLASNKLDNKAMTTITTQYRTTLNTFRADYISYEQKMSEALKIDCTKNADSFYYTVSDARSLRATVHDDVQKLHRIIDDYSSSVKDFTLNFERVSQ